MRLVEFTDVRRRVDAEPRLGIQSKGRLSLNAVAVERLGRPTHVVLLFDPDGPFLGVRPADQREPHAYRLTGTGKANEARTVSLVALFNHYGVDGDQYLGGYIPNWDDEIGGLVVRLGNQPTESTHMDDDDIPF